MSNVNVPRCWKEGKRGAADDLSLPGSGAEGISLVLALLSAVFVGQPGRGLPVGLQAIEPEAAGLAKPFDWSRLQFQLFVGLPG